MFSLILIKNFEKWNLADILILAVFPKSEDQTPFSLHRVYKDCTF